MKTIFANGRHLAAARALGGLTQSALAERAGLHVNSVKYHERRTGSVAGHAPERFAAVLAELGIIVLVRNRQAVLEG